MTIPTNSERDCAYGGVITRGSTHRVIACKDDMQWIIQRQKGGDGGRWLSLAHCRCKKTLLRLWSGLNEAPSPVLNRLPNIKGRSNHGE
ncbi:hypothetical protein [Albirhodobacter sp. R86504]|uniref:hypothetical protein n=1 Tax=Albirhodobacter sp. R86504 TaxID=3093848 RepID=UPI00367171ED